MRCSTKPRLVASNGRLCKWCFLRFAANGAGGSISQDRRLAAWFKHLTSVIGVGETAAAHFSAELFLPERFNRPEEVTSYLGRAAA
ncbi:transposase [Leisingera thetidis]|uniref:transposase n=1 Tax=Leisingera thetidis TaxID=2930199 RepID=UPI003313D466